MIAVGPSPSTSDQSRILILVHLSAFGRSEYILDSPWKSRRISTRFIVLRLPKIALVLKFRRTAAHYKGRPAGYTRIGPSPQAQPANGGPESYRNQMSNDWGAIYELTPTGGDGDIRLDRGRNHWLGSAYCSPDGRHLAFTQMTYENNVWMLENF